MNLEFKIYKLKEDSSFFKIISKFNDPNEFAVIGQETIEGKEYFKALQLFDGGLKLIGSLKLDKLAYSIPKDDMIAYSPDGIGVEYTEMEIPVEYLTLDIIENIRILNA